MRLLVVLAMLLAGALLVPPAQAARTDVSGDTIYSGLRTADGQVFYETLGGSGYEIRSAAAGRAPQTLRTYAYGQSDEDCCSTSTGVAFAVSPTRLATLVDRANFAKGVFAGGDVRLAAGPPAPGQETVVSSCGQGEVSTVGGIDVDGDRLAYVDACSSDTHDVVIRDLASGATVKTTEAPGTQVGAIRLRGHYLAIAYATGPPPSASTQVVVRDIDAGTDVISAPVTGGFDLQDDGKLVATNGTPVAPGCQSGVYWYSPAEPTAHPLPFCPASGPRIDGDRVLLEVETPAGDQPRELVVSDLSGAARTLVSGGISTISPYYDLRDGRAAFALNSCKTGTGHVYIDDLSDGLPLDGGDGTCPVDLLTRSVRASRKGAVKLRFDCPHGCGGSVTLAVRRRSLGRERDFAAKDGAVTATNFHLSRSARKTLIRSGRLKVTARWTRSDLGASEQKTLKRSITLLAPRKR